MEGFEMTGMKAAEKIGSLMKYRDALDETERELFDVLIQYANEIAAEVGCGAGPVRQPC